MALNLCVNMKRFFYSFFGLLTFFLSTNSFAQSSCSTITEFPFSEGFEDDSTTRDCWTQDLVSGTEGQDYWIYATGALNGSITQAHSGTMNARARRYPYSDQSIVKLISPKMDISTLDTPTLTFYHAQEAWGIDQSELKVYYRLNANSSWILLKHYWSNISTWTQEIIELPEKSSELQIAFEATNNFGRSVVVDDVLVGNEAGETGSCMPSTPSNNYENGNGNLNELYIANDFTINAYINLNISQIKLNIIEMGGVENFDIVFYDSNDYGLPNEVIASFTGLTASSTTDLHTTDSGFTFQENIIDLPVTYVLKGGPSGKKIWLSVKAKGNETANNLFWEVTTIMNSSNTAMYSGDGITWNYINGEMDGVFTLIGTCEAGDPTEDYCEPGFWFVMPITSVTFSDLTNVSNADSTEGYENFSEYSANVNKGQTYTLEIESTTYTVGTQNFTVFIDWNQNGNLNDEGERYEVGTITNSNGQDGQKVEFPIEIPSTAALGNARMRIISEVYDYVSSACGVYSQGQAEDYTITVADALSTAENNSAEFSIYPNPTDAELFIKTNAKIKTSEVFNTAGQVVLKNNSKTLDLSSLSKGIYILKTTFENGTVKTQKIIKK